MKKFFNGFLERAVGHWKSSAIATGEAGAMVGASQTLTDSPEVQQFAVIFAALRILIGFLQKDNQK